ncbi:MAG: hypothetical protein IIB43_10005 [Candidatus Marinimicrobia bacterium]|nr:hypothetical protein [Candidatus Neomarinimicrobiota bacterium]
MVNRPEAGGEAACGRLRLAEGALAIVLNGLEVESRYGARGRPGGYWPMV